MVTSNKYQPLTHRWLSSFSFTHKMDANADNVADEIQSHPVPEVSATRQSSAKLMVQALVTIPSAIKKDLPDHAILRSHTEQAAAPVGQSAEQLAIESVDQAGKVKAAKRPLPIDVLVVDENSQAKQPRVNKSTPSINVGQENQLSTDDNYDPDRLLSTNFIGSLVRNLMPTLKSCQSHYGASSKEPLSRSFQGQLLMAPSLFFFFNEYIY